MLVGSGWASTAGTLAAQGLDAAGGHLMTQELDSGGGEHALLCVDDQARLAQPRENFSQKVGIGSAGSCIMLAVRQVIFTYVQ